jgi:hypothetical protein
LFDETQRVFREIELLFTCGQLQPQSQPHPQPPKIEPLPQITQMTMMTRMIQQKSIPEPEQLLLHIELHMGKLLLLEMFTPL